MRRADSSEKTLMLGKLKAGGEGDNRGWDGQMASPNWWTWVWASSGSWWWTGRPGVLQSMGSQRIGHDWMTELNWRFWTRLLKVKVKVAQLCLTLCDPMNHSTPGLSVHHQLPESTQTHVHRVSDAIQPSHLLSSPSSPALNLSQHQGLSQGVSSSHQVAKGLELQLQHQSFQWIFRIDLLYDWHRHNNII